MLPTLATDGFELEFVSLAAADVVAHVGANVNVSVAPAAPVVVANVATVLYPQLIVSISNPADPNVPLTAAGVTATLTAASSSSRSRRQSTCRFSSRRARRCPRR